MNRTVEPEGQGFEPPILHLYNIFCREGQYNLVFLKSYCTSLLRFSPHRSFQFMCFISEIEKWDFKPKTFLFECENWVYSQITINETGLTKSQRKSLRRKRCKRIGRRIDLLIEEIRKSGLTGELLQKAHQLHLIVSNSELEMDEIIERESDAIHKGRFGVGIVVAPLPPDAAYICIWKDC